MGDAKSAFIYAYVISGAIESKVNDGETRIYSGRRDLVRTAGRKPFDRPQDRAGKALAVFVLNTDDDPLTTPIK